MTPRLPLELKQETIPVEVFRDRFLKLQARDGLTYGQLARRLDYFERGRPDINRARRDIGLGLCHYRGRGHFKQVVSYDMAVRLCRALDLDPFECGI